MNLTLFATGLAFLTATLASLGWPPTRLDIHTEIEIAVAPAVVWAVLADNRRYGEWNPYHVRVEGELVKGSKLDVELHKPDGTIVHIRPHVLAIEPTHRLDWGGGIRGLFRGVHVFELIATGDNCTRLIQRETFSGLFVGFAKLNGIAEGYDGMNRALKAHLEKPQTPTVCGNAA